MCSRPLAAGAAGTTVALLSTENLYYNFYFFAIDSGLFSPALQRASNEITSRFCVFSSGFDTRQFVRSTEHGRAGPIDAYEEVPAVGDVEAVRRIATRILRAETGGKRTVVVQLGVGAVEDDSRSFM